MWMCGNDCECGEVRKEVRFRESGGSLCFLLVCVGVRVPRANLIEWIASARPLFGWLNLIQLHDICVVSLGCEDSLMGDALLLDAWNYGGCLDSGEDGQQRSSTLISQEVICLPPPPACLPTP